MAELFEQFAFINALLGGFAITFLSAIIVVKKTDLIHKIMIGSLIVAISCFIGSALSSTFASVAVVNAADSATEIVEPLIRPISNLFLLGIIILFATLGQCGFLLSKKFGWITVALATSGFSLAIAMISPFISWQGG